MERKIIEKIVEGWGGTEKIDSGSKEYRKGYQRKEIENNTRLLKYSDDWDPKFEGSCGELLKEEE